MKTPLHRHPGRTLYGRALTYAFLTLVLVAIIGNLAEISAASGDLDPSFAGSGIVTTNFLDHYDDAQAVAIQGDGKIVVAGNASAETDVYVRAALARYLTDGMLDQTFGSGGLVMNEFATVRDLAVQPDGKILVAGRTSADDMTADFYISRYNPDGSLDVTFGVGGIVTTDFHSGFDSANAIALQSDGKIVVTGIAHVPASSNDFAVARYLPNGDLDVTFGISGKVSTDFNGQHDIGHDVAIQPDGKIVIAGQANGGDFGIVRYEANGDVDVSFGTNGRATADFNNALDEAFGVGIQSDGKIVAGGRAGLSGIDADFGLVRFTAGGLPDVSFGVAGEVTTDFLTYADRINDLIIQPDDKIVAAGLVTIWADLSSGDIDFGLARYNPDGSLDATFGTSGKVTTSFGGSESAVGVTLQPDCKIVAAGFANPPNTTDSMFAVARYDAGACGAPTACPKPQGYWKNNSSLWPVQSLVLGNQTYTQSELLALLNNSTKTDASVVLAKQLIAGKLNVENGAPSAPIATSIENADNILSGFSGKLPYKVKPPTASGQTMLAISAVLDGYNSGFLADGCLP